jgi:glutamine amidotransferase
MCRFSAYLGRISVPLSCIVNGTDNSLVKQSCRVSAKSKKGANADGFGFGWYESNLDKPQVFKDTDPIYENNFFINMSSMTRSKCFIGHIRAATVGAVSERNCHPFVGDNILFVHNGTIRGFNKIKNELQYLQDVLINEGDTDSRTLFNIFYKNLENSTLDLDSAMKSFRLIIKKIKSIQTRLGSNNYSTLNIAVTDGKKLFATRYVSNINKKCLSLYYTYTKDGIIVSSEPLVKNHKNWQLVPVNHALLIDYDLSIKIIKI